MASENLRWLGLCALTLAACAGTRLNDVGDINTGGSGGGAAGPGGTAVGDGGADASPIPAGGRGPVVGGGMGGRVVTIDPTYAGGPLIEGGSPDVGPPDPVCVGCSTVVADAGDVRDLEVNEQKVFWIDHGSFDKLGNYQNDGRLVARPLAGGPLEVLADALPGPSELELSSKYAYMLVDSVEGLKPFALVRLPLAGGPLETLKSQADGFGGIALFEGVGYPADTGGVIATSADFTYVANLGGIYRVAETPGATLEVVVPEYAGNQIIADTKDVYLFSSGYRGSEIDFVAAASGQPTLFHTVYGEATPVALDDTYLYFQEGIPPYNSSYLTRITRSSGATKRLAKMDDAGRFALRDGRFFGNEPVSNPRNGQILADRIFQGSLTSPDTVTDLVVDAPDTLRFMAPSSVGLFFAGKGVVRLAPFLP